MLPFLRRSCIPPRMGWQIVALGSKTQGIKMTSESTLEGCHIQEISPDKSRTFCHPSGVVRQAWYPGVYDPGVLFVTLPGSIRWQYGEITPFMERSCYNAGYPLFDHISHAQPTRGGRSLRCPDLADKFDFRTAGNFVVGQYA